MDYKQLISDPLSIQSLLAGSMSPGSSYEEWEDKRKFISKHIDSGGSILDIGCANGFFLRSLQEWSGNSLVPYGVDMERDLIQHAKGLFPEYNNNFVVLDVKNIGDILETGLPNVYDYIYWNFSGDWKISDRKWQEIYRQILEMAQKRFIIGFYGTNKYPYQSEEWKVERERIMSRPGEFEQFGFIFSGMELNPTIYNQVIAWIDK